MKTRTVPLFCCLILALAISSSDEEKVRKKSTAKVQVKNVSGGKKGTTVAPLKAKGITKNKKKKTTSKSSLPTTNEVQEMPMTVNALVEINTPRMCEMEVNVKCNPMGSLMKKLHSTGKTPEGGQAIIGYDGKKWYKSEYAEQHSYQYAYQTCCNLDMHLPWANYYYEFKILYDFMNGSRTDNFYAETSSAPEGEKWCGTRRPLEPEMSNDGFMLLKEKSILYTQKNSLPKYKLKTIATSAMEASVKVNHFFCQPNEEEN